jgi:hypothetical protein
MPTPTVLLMTLVLTLLPQANGDRIDEFLQVAPNITSSLNALADEVVPGPLLQKAKATLLDDYGVILSLEVRLDAPPNPFARRRPVESLRRLSTARLRTLKDRIVDFMGETLPDLGAISPSESLTVVVHVLNTNPVDMPDLPMQVMFTATRQDAMDLAEGKISQENFRSRVRITEY